MSQRANTNPLPPGQPDLFRRRAAAVGLGLFFYYACGSFTPVSWLTQPDWTTYLDGPRLIDRVLGPVVLIGAAILHWYIASQRAALPLTISIPSGPLDAATNNNNVNNINNTTFVLGMWLPSYFWPFAVAEAAILYAVAFGSVWGVMARFVIVALVVCVWVLGWNSMPWYRKQQAWAFMKDYVVRLLIMELMDSAFGSGGRRRRRR
ncbi:hypothetical protein VMCG_08218 [Cytospora schulzeri]|uniref:Uncharacterized protein n=1 Tax=Cytospora schulzeri TaxID=448051 RepID=A0A423VSL3_9PEZI|nr:hypothetical protein VMCG_08218 [Valsa malicola]